MADFSIDSLDAVQAGTATADTLKKLANDGRNAACGFFHAYPHTVIPNPFVDYLDSFWDGLCQNSSSGLPPAPVPPFHGGQCRTLTYVVSYSMDIYEKNPPGLNAHYDHELTVPGDIQSIMFGVDPRDPTPGDGAVGIFISAWNSTTQMYAIHNDSYGYSGNFYVANGVINSITPTSGVDNCGDPPVQYPPDNPPPIPTTPGGSTYNTTNQNVTYNNGNTYEVTPTLNLAANFNPTVQIGGVNVSFGGGGATISPPGTLPPTSGNDDNTNLLRKIAQNLGDGSLAGGGVGAAAAKAANQTAPTPKPGSPGTQPPVTKPPTTKTSKNIPNLSAVEIVITTPPEGDKEIFAYDSEYNVFIAGWFSWLQGDYALQREPIQYLNSIWFAPPGTDGYTYTLSSEAVGHAVESQVKPPT